MATKDDWVGRVVFVLAIALAFAFVVGVVTLALSPTPFGGENAHAIGAGFAGMLGIVGGYVLGTRLVKGKNEGGK